MRLEKCFSNRIMIYFFIADLPLILLALQLVPQPFFEDLVDSHISLIGV